MRHLPDESTWDERWPHRTSDDPDQPKLEVEENPVVGRILGPRGETIRVVRARATVLFGFR